MWRFIAGVLRLYESWGSISPSDLQHVDTNMQLVQIVGEHTASRQRLLLICDATIYDNQLEAAETGCGDERDMHQMNNTCTIY
jgi:hypothetical protein